jgi:hypothetical protein
MAGFNSPLVRLNGLGAHKRTWGVPAQSPAQSSAETPPHVAAPRDQVA